MDVRLSEKISGGKVTLPPLKSAAGLYFILAALSCGETVIETKTPPDEIFVIASCLKALGASVTPASGGYRVTPVALRDTADKSPELDVENSAFALKTLLPVSLAVSSAANFCGGKSLSKKSLAVMLSSFKSAGYTSENLPLTVNGTLAPGKYEVGAEAGAHFLGGLLIALSVLDGDSAVYAEKGLCDKQFINETVSAIKSFGGEAARTEYGFNVKGGGLVSPGRVTVPCDFYGAFPFIALNEFYGGVSFKGDYEISASANHALTCLKEIRIRGGGKYKVSSFDAVCVLLAAACLTRGETEFEFGGSFTPKDAERAERLVIAANKSGFNASFYNGGVKIISDGVARGGVIVDCYGDYRAAIFASLVAVGAERPVTLLSVDALKKTYPEFFNDLIKLGAKAETL